MERPCVTDLTLMTIAQVPAKAALAFCRLVLSFGAEFAELPAPLYRSIEGEFPPEHVCLRVTLLDEYIHFKGRGIKNFSADLRGYAAICQSGGLPADGELAVILPNGEPVAYSLLGMTPRICGLDGVMRQDYQKAFSAMIEQYGESVCFDAGDRDHMATAAALEFLYCGGRQICTSFVGLGGHASTERLMAALNVMEGAEFDLTRLPELREVCELLTKHTVPGYWPVAGREIFIYESGIHADGIEKNPKNYEPFEPESVGANRALVLGKHSGRAAIRQKLLEHGLAPSGCMIDALSRAVRDFSEENRRGLTDSEFLSLYRRLNGGIEGG